MDRYNWYHYTDKIVKIFKITRLIHEHRKIARWRNAP